MDRIDVETVTEATPELRDLIAELDATLAVDYAPEQRHGLTLEALLAPHVRLYVARLEGQPMGCGGVALFAQFAEVKRMYVRPAARGKGIAQALLERIEAETIAGKLDILRLETGIFARAAIRLYERAGFARRGAFGDYAALAPEALATSVFFEKCLRPGRADGDLGPDCADDKPRSGRPR